MKTNRKKDRVLLQKEIIINDIITCLGAETDLVEGSLTEPLSCVMEFQFPARGEMPFRLLVRDSGG